MARSFLGRWLGFEGGDPVLELRDHLGVFFGFELGFPRRERGFGVEGDQGLGGLVASAGFAVGLEGDEGFDGRGLVVVG